MFNEQGSWLEAATTFRDTRIALTQKEIVSPSGVLTPRVYLHILPLGRLGDSIDLRGRREELHQDFPPMRHGGWDFEYNEDGIRMTSFGTDRVVFGYTQILRCGGVEAMSFMFGDRPTEQRKFISLWGIELIGELREFIPARLKAMQEKLGILPPYAVFISLEDVKDARMTVSLHGMVGQPMPRIRLRLPPIFIEDSAAYSEEDLFRALDVLWQAAGQSGAPRPAASAAR